MQHIYNNINDTIILLDNSLNIDEILKNKFYQITFIKNNFEFIMNHYENVDALE